MLKNSESLRVQFNGINDPFIDNQSIYSGITDERNNFLREGLKTISEPICGDDYVLGPEEFKEMGITNLVTGFYWEYNYNEDSQKLVASFGFSVTDLYTASLKINISNQKSVDFQDGDVSKLLIVVSGDKLPDNLICRSSDLT